MSAFAVSSVFMGAITYPLFANWAWGGGWLSQLGANFDLGHGYADFAGSGVVHAVGGITALALAMIIGPRLGKYTREGQTQRRFPDTISSSSSPDASSWPSAGSDSTRAARSPLPVMALCASVRSQSTPCSPA